MDHEPARIRGYQPGDLDDLFRICLQTADSGQDGSHLFHDPTLPGDVYAAPYAIFEPSLAFVAEDQSGVGGYVVAALDSRLFERRLAHDWWPALRVRYPEPPQDRAESMSPAERRALHYIHHPPDTDPALAERFPSHLHINLVPRLQGRGAGRQLITTVISSLRDQGSPGLHLHVGYGNTRAPGFYRHVGFTELPVAEARVFAMDLTEQPGQPPARDATA